MGCNGCGGNCSSCSGCAGQMELSTGEISILEALGQYSFLPVARRADDMMPVYLEDSEYSKEEYSLILQCLEKKKLIDLDYSAPLTGADMSAYAGYPVHGSIALTARGQGVLELIEIQGFAEETK